VLREQLHDHRRCGDAGWGLFIVGFMAADHGTYLTSTGKAVWFELAAWSRAGQHADG
jgi:hypothetical protein